MHKSVMMVDGSAIARLTTTSGPLRSYVVRHLMSQDHGCRSCLQLTIAIHDCIQIRPRTLTVQGKNHEVLITLTNIRGLNRNIDSSFFSSCSIFDRNSALFIMCTFIHRHPTADQPNCPRPALDGNSFQQNFVFFVYEKYCLHKSPHDLITLRSVFINSPNSDALLANFPLHTVVGSRLKKLQQ